ncbi:MAG: penicillin-binding protein 2 [Clostridia bacterium]|nr:penicillin-binding protein 2 [Clostridia bacterium]
MSKKIKKENINLRFNILSLLGYLVGIALIIQLFNLQIVNGETYREQSNTRLSRESELQAARGDILDSSGNVLATSKMGFSLELYKTKIDDETLNNSILELINVLEQHKQSYVDSFPIKPDPYEFTLKDQELSNWKAKNKLKEDASAEDCFNYFKKKYKITHENPKDVKKILAIRYEITTKGYSSTRPINIAKDINPQVVSILSEKSEKFPGINIVTESIRTYTSGSLASHILGYIGKISEEEYNNNKDIYDNDDITGKTGIESIFEKYLRGKDGIKQIDMSVDGTVAAEYVSEEATGGSDIVLTIDSNLQRITENALKENMAKITNGGFSQAYHTKSGSVVVMNVKTGEVLAMASNPDFEPQQFVGGISSAKYNEYKSSQGLFNRTISGSYAPGSTFKMITAIAGLESGVIDTRTKINDTGIYPKYTNPVCWYYTSFHRGHGYLNVSDAIKHSCNYFFYETGDRMGIDNLAKYARYFGLGKKTGIELPSETSGTLASRETKKEKTGEDWYAGETTSAAIGQSYNSFSPLQMAKYISMLANGGHNIQPTIIKTVRNADGSEISKEEIRKFTNEKLGINEDSNEELPIKQENLNAVLEGMRSVTSETGGTAYNIFKDFNIEVGGKTGSAETSTGDVNAWFVGFAPFENPEIAIVIMVENGGHGNYTAEVVRDIMAEYFGMNIQQIQEDVSASPYTESMH